MDRPLDSLLDVCLAAARAGARELAAHAATFGFREKNPADFVTDADLASERAIRDAVLAAFPGDGFLGEESADRSQLDEPYCWVADPLDGTTNYVHRNPCYATSVAVAHRGELLAGVVLDPTREECFAAAKGQGATLNGRPIRVSSAPDLRSALAAVSLPYGITRESPDLASFVEMAIRCQAIRRTGSAALNLAYVACGRFDIHWAYEIHPWDAAAGVLLIQEAGGIATGCDGRPFVLAEADYMTAATESLHREALEALRGVG
ncbi:MAG: inositol monophosphatase [Pirellulales bacterium]|nr:inositol monophosphatase [Pirellulales bacterium]